MEKEKIIQTTSALYARYGIKGVSMDQIAHELGISKKTIYEAFEDKEQLLTACIDYQTSRLVRSIEKTTAEAKSSLDALLLVGSKIFRHYGTPCPAFFKDLVRYPKAYARLKKFRADVKATCMEYFRKGIEEGSFEPGMDYEVISSLFVEQFSNMQIEYQGAMLLTFLKGICTPKGLAQLNEYIPGGSFPAINRNNIAQL